MSNRYGSSMPYEEEAIWTRGGNDRYNLRSKSPPIHYQTSQPTANTPRPATTIVHSSIKPIPDSDIYKVGIYGWRKRCLYVFILLLTIVIVINLALTIWIMTVLDFSTEGIGALKVEKDGIKVHGRSEFEKPALTIDSGLGISINAHNFSGYSTASLNLNPDGKATAVCERFEVLNPERKLLFYVDSQEIGLKLENLRILGNLFLYGLILIFLDDGGSIFEGAIQTALIRPEPDSPLSLEAPTRSLNIEAGQDIELLSSAGEIQLNSLLDINLKSKQGDIRIESGNVYVSGLERSMGRGQAQYQLCICQNGRLFMAAEQSDCRADRSICD